MSTTTPRLSPRDSCEPIPITSIGLPGEYSPTSATTLEVPMSSPTMSALSPLRFMMESREWGMGNGEWEGAGTGGGLGESIEGNCRSRGTSHLRLGHSRFPIPLSLLFAPGQREEIG